MLEDQRPGAAYWIDHYVVPTADTARWGSFYTNVMGAVTRSNEGRPDRPERADRGGSTLFTYVGLCHVGGSPRKAGLTPGSGFPRYSYFIRGTEVDEHLRRLDANGVRHSGPIKTSEEGEDGVAINFADPDGNGLQFWAPARLPDGAMNDESPAKVGRIASAAFESRDLARTAEFYSRYCGLDPLRSNELSRDTAVFPLAGAGRLVFKQVDRLGDRTLGHAFYRALHTALVVRDDEFMPAMERMYAELPEWDFDPDNMPKLSAEEAEALPARTCIHGSPQGPGWKRTLGRGDSFCDWDTVGYHFVAAKPVSGSMAIFEPVSQMSLLPERRGA
jgi:catechol 2,3-dioxygenase-like lactoylglutathione lyase family enzyme